MYKKLQSFLYENNIDFKTDQELSKLSTFQVGGPADYLISPTSVEQTHSIQKFLYSHNIPVFYLSGGSNVLFSDEGFRGVVVKANYSSEMTFENVFDNKTTDALVTAYATIKSSLFSKQLAQKGFSGFEFLSTIPGELAGAIVQNAGCYGSEIKDTIVEVTASDFKQLYFLTIKDLEFKYRTSVFKRKKELFIHKAVFRAKKGIGEDINSKIKEYKNNRMQTQPRNRKCAGSIFKNPTGQPGGKKAWQLITESGLQGSSCGDAEVSKDHANFIINNGKATSKDVLTLIDHIKSKVKQTTGVSLHEEIVIVDPN